MFTVETVVMILVGLVIQFFDLYLRQFQFRDFWFGLMDGSNSLSTLLVSQIFFVLECIIQLQY